VKPLRLSGLIAAPFTPFKADFSLNLDRVPQIAQHLTSQKVTGAFIGGTTGEWASLTLAERRSLAEAWRKVTGPDLKLIVHVGHNCLGDSQELARHAESLGADAIAAIMPSFFRPANLESMGDFCRQIAQAAPNTPFYFYHFPDITGVNFNMDEFLPVARQSIPTFAGIKFTHSNLMDFGLVLAAAGDRYDVLFGRDEILLGGLAAGAKGAVGSTYNYSARLHYEMMCAYSEGNADEARKLEVYIQRSVFLLQKYGGGISAGKSIMAQVGVDCGPFLPPLSPLAAKGHAGLRADLDALDFFAKVKA
jgi:N-acetylneuraminate lyase